MLRRQVSFTWLVAGEGADRAALEAEAARLGVPVRFLGPLPAEQLASAMQAADIVLHPAPGELFPNVVAEAMALERPVVALDSGAAPELLGRDGKAGVLVPEEDPLALSEGLSELLRSQARRSAMGSEARRRLLAEFPLQRMEHAYAQLVEDCTGAAAVASTQSPASLTAR
jgi:glycosyltransferase involved in cell wall biosynthesis